MKKAGHKMEGVLTKNINGNLARDRFLWVIFILFMASLAFFMLWRDSQKQYGAIAYGGFPAFVAVDSDGKLFDEHKLQGQLSAVIVTDEPLAGDIALYLHKLSQATALGKKYLKTMVLINGMSGPSDKWVGYLTIQPDGFDKIVRWKDNLFKKGVILVDQNGIIRGIFDLEDKLERLNFESAVRGIL